MSKTVSFEIEDGDFVAVMPFVDGTSLAALVEIYERSKGYLDPAGGYGGLVPAYFNYGPLDQYLAGRSNTDHWASLNGIYILGCACGEVGCWPLITGLFSLNWLSLAKSAGKAATPAATPGRVRSGRFLLV